MTQLIDKSALIAEIEKYYKECLKRAKITDPDYWNAKADAYRNVLVILNATLEVKQDTVHGTVDYPLIGCDFPNIYPNYKELKEYCDRNGIKDNDKVKLIIIKDI